MPFYCPIKLELASLLPSTDATAAAAASTSLLLSLSAFLRQLSLFCFCYCFPLCEINKWNKLCSSVSRILHRDYTNILSFPVPACPLSAPLGYVSHSILIHCWRTFRVGQTEESSDIKLYCDPFIYHPHLFSCETSSELLLVQSFSLKYEEGRETDKRDTVRPNHDLM